jgi:tetratricopeptide (TPR) repeat protein
MPLFLRPSPWSLALVTFIACTSGCAALPWSDAKPVKYETVPSSERHDTAGAKKKHAEALALIECADPTKHLNKAEVLLNEALVADVTYGPAHNSLGMVYYLQQKLYLAAWEFEYATKLMPDLAEPYNNLGLVYEQAGKYDEAISYYSMALSRDQNDPKVIGNLVRARLTTGDKNAELKSMMSDLALYHPDPAWQTWARDQVELEKFDGEGDLGRSWNPPSAPPEVMPSPVREPELIMPALPDEIANPAAAPTSKDG